MRPHSIDSGKETYKYDLKLMVPATGESGVIRRQWFIHALVEKRYSHMNDYGPLAFDANIGSGDIGFHLNMTEPEDPQDMLESSLFIDLIDEVLDRGVTMPEHKPLIAINPSEKIAEGTLRAHGKIWTLLWMKDFPFRKEDREALIREQQEIFRKQNDHQRRLREQIQFGLIQHWFYEKWEDEISPRVGELIERQKEYEAEANSLRCCTYIATAREIEILVRERLMSVSFNTNTASVRICDERDSTYLSAYTLRPGDKPLHPAGLPDVRVECARRFYYTNPIEPERVEARKNDKELTVSIRCEDPFALQITPRQAERCKVEWSMQSDAV